MFKIKNLTMRNFLSVGAVTQAVNFDRNDLTLVLGENLDLGGDDSGSRNGVGKSSICNALSYAFYGQALTSIKKDNLINKTNAKGMLVTIEFEKDGQTFRIDRGRRPGILTLFKGDAAFEAKDNDAQGDSRETQHEINRILCMTHDMFKHIVVLNTYTEPFLSLNANNQRILIEQLLGITILSEKAEVLKELIKGSKELITNEEYRIKSLIDANKKIEEHLSAIKIRRDAWDTKRQKDVEDLQTEITDLLKIDISVEIEAHEMLADWIQQKKNIEDLGRAMSQAQKELDRESKGVLKLLPEITALENHTCHACGHEIHDDKQTQILDAKNKLLEEHQSRLIELDQQITELSTKLNLIGKLPTEPTTHYAKIEGAFNHRSTVEHRQQQLDTRLNEENPHNEQVRDMEALATTEVSYDIINNATQLKEHQEFLLKLLTSKDSFIRKRIIDQNLTYLNSRLSYYLDRIGLPHTVIFQSDLTVEITELGRELDFYNLSRGEMTRVILALSFSFRDVYESLYEPVNLLFVDEMIDSGMDMSGVENTMSLLKKMSRDFHKSVWLISHKDELAGRVSNTLHVQKEGGFTQFLCNDEG